MIWWGHSDTGERNNPEVWKVKKLRQRINLFFFFFPFRAVISTAKDKTDSFVGSFPNFVRVCFHFNVSRKVDGKSHGFYVITALQMSFLKPLKPGTQHSLWGSTADRASCIIFPEGVRNTCV